MKAFSTDELGKDLNNLDLYSDILPTQQSLGLSWDLHSDKFIFRRYCLFRRITKKCGFQDG
jgi:hypothetical protein